VLSQRNNDYLSRAYELSRLGHYDLALQEVQRALEQDPQSAEAHVCGAWIWRDQGRLPEAEQAARAALGLQPNSAPAHHILAVVLWDQGRIADAEVAFRDALRFNHPDQAVYLVNFGRMMNANYRSQEALELADRALALAPGMSGAHDVRGLALARLGRTAEARAEYLEALRLNPRNAVAHNNLGVLALGEGQADAATESFRSALRLNPNDERARRNLLLALKARYPVYGWALALNRYMQSPADFPRWRRLLLLLLGLIIGLPILALLFPVFGKIGAALWMLLLPTLLVAMALTVIWKALADPIFNTLLQFDPVGRQVHEFDSVEAAVSIQAGVALMGAVLFVVALVALSKSALGPPLMGIGASLAMFCYLMAWATSRFSRVRKTTIKWSVYRYLLVLYYGVLAAGLADQLYPTRLHLPFLAVGGALALMSAWDFSQRQR
jgi:Flp pilus assembly protein TadD